MNHVSLIGRLTKDLELRKVPSGTSVTRFVLAVNRRIKNEGQPEADFITCTAWGKTADTMYEYLGKGSQIGVEGRIQTGKYEDGSGKTIYTTEVVIEHFDFIGSKSKDNSNSNNAYQNQTQYESTEIESDDLPF